MKYADKGLLRGDFVGEFCVVEPWRPWVGMGVEGLSIEFLWWKAKVSLVFANK